jgi:hypothetical protein
MGLEESNTALIVAPFLAIGWTSLPEYRQKYRRLVPQALLSGMGDTAGEF